jgi:uncharacterized protein YegJ (DUF2314 family)
MERHLFFAASLSALALLALGCENGTHKKEKVSEIEDNDPEMVEAIAKARAKLPDFWEKFDHSKWNEAEFSLRVRVKDDNGVELFWLSDLERKKNALSGVVSTKPKVVKCVRLGQRIPIPDADIVDWLYTRNGKIVGNYTLRALFSKMSPEEVRECKDRLETP